MRPISAHSFMSWYKIAQHSAGNLRGEWWFRDGHADFADGDIGDYNHASMAIESAQGEISSDFSSILQKYRSKLEEMGIWDKVGHAEFMEGEFKEALDAIMDADYGSSHEGIYEDIVNEITAKHGTDCAKAALREDGDAAITWGLKKGWVRCHGNYLEVWMLNSAILSSIVDGLYSAYGEEGLLGDKTELSIEQRSNKAYFPGVPLSVLESGNIMSLAAYKDRS